MKKQHEHNIDDLFDKAFSDFKEEPSEQIWENVRKQIPLVTNVTTSKKSFFSGKYFYLFFSAAIVVVVTATLLYFRNNNSGTITKPAQSKTGDIKITDNNNVNTNNSGNNGIHDNSVIANNDQSSSQKENDAKQNSSVVDDHLKQTTNNSKEFIQTNILPERKSVNEKNKNFVSENIKKPNTAQDAALAKLNVVDKPKDDNELKTINETQNINKTQAANEAQNAFLTDNKNNVTANNELKNEKNDEYSNTVQNIKSFDKYSKIDVSRTKCLSSGEAMTINSDLLNASAGQSSGQNNHFRPRIYFGVHYTAEWIYNLPEFNSLVNVKRNNFTQSGQLSINYDFRHLIFQTGIGYSFYNNETTNNIKYISRDSVGYYEDVISYTIDTAQHIIYNTTPKNIYDSVKHTIYTTSKNSYRYFQIPLLIGYKGYLKKFSFTVRSGVGVGILSYKNEPVTSFNVSNASLISIENNTPTLTKTYWQFLFNVGLGYQLSANISIAVEPTFKYYLNSFYENTNATKHPYSIGIKTGLYFHF